MTKRFGEFLVLAGICVMATVIARPSFDRWQARARQAEAMSALAMIYTGESIYHAAHGVYTYCLSETGYDPGAGDRFYLSGFLSGAFGSSCVGPAVSMGGTLRTAGAFAMNRWANTDLTWHGIAGDFEPRARSFRAVAFGSISRLSPIFDVWTIDEKKQLVNEQSGL